jgi:amino acid adenylation domain-containing protein
MTQIPRWPPGQPAGPVSADHTVPLPAALHLALTGVAAELGVGGPDLVFAAHAAVLATLTGEVDLRTGYGGGVVRIQVPSDGSWRALVEAVRSAAAGPEPGTADTSFTAGDAATPAVALQVAYTRGALRLRYRADLIDADHAARIGGYLQRALEQVAADPGAPWHTADLLSAAGREHLVRFGSGRPRPLPDRRFAELFAEQARRTPSAPAIVHSGHERSYAWLDRAANRVAHALLAAGVGPEDVVAVATERDAGWAAAVIGVLRAGAGYLPIEPSLPAARAAAMLARSRCRVLLAGHQPATRPAGAAGPARLDIDELLRAPGPDSDPGVAVPAGSLAYVYFTSGSTGVPKGAMCEHLGMLNHLYAKVDDLGLGPGDVVVQNAQISFDISLWQLAAPLLVGARAVIARTDDILDPARFVDLLVGNAATIVQVVPSYLEVLLRHLEQHPRDLGPLRYVSVTGEAVARSLVARWLAAYPAVPLVNAYGATEASDDTTHEVITEPPPGESVPVGRPNGNVTVYVLGRRGELVPPGSIGEIAFSGSCVGRGYVGDPARTAEVFRPDPLRPGTRLYRTGDFGRWLPCGSIQFHGRRDEQVKIRGVRIEVGEVESRMLAHPLVRQASVVVLPDQGSGKLLVGYYVADGPLEPGDLGQFLAAGLPAAACPSWLYRLGELPLTGNGKTDKQALLGRARVGAPARGTAGAPATPTECRVAAAWAEALGRPAGTIRRDDDFFGLGGTSLSALRVVAALDGLVSLADLVRTPVLSGVAAAADRATPAAGRADGAR